MTGLVLFLMYSQAAGAAIGAFTAVWSEYAYVQVMRDGKIDTAERTHLQKITHGLRFGMSLLLLSSLGLVIAAFAMHATVQPAVTASYWIFALLVLVVIGMSWALARRHISFPLGSATLFTSWWFLAYLTTGWLSPLTFGSAAALLVVATALMSALLYYVRLLSKKQIA